MALSEELKKRISVAVTKQSEADELISAIEASVASPAAVVSAMGSTTNLSAISASYADLAAARTSVNTLKGEAEARLDAIEAKIDEMLASFKASGQMQS